jgi:hypothetical protein
MTSLAVYPTSCLAPASGSGSGLAFGKAPMKTGSVSGMKVPHREGLANHLGPEACAGVGNGVGAALTGGWAGGVGSLARGRLLGADVVRTHGRQHGVAR